MKFHHTGCAVRDIDDSRKKMSLLLNAQATPVIYDPLQKANLCMLVLKDGSRIELISGEVVENLILKGINYYHVCYAVNNIEETLSFMASNGAVIISKPKPAILFDGKPVAFLLSPVGIIELLEDQEFCSIQPN